MYLNSILKFCGNLKNFTKGTTLKSRKDQDQKKENKLMGHKADISYYGTAFNYNLPTISQRCPNHCLLLELREITRKNKKESIRIKWKRKEMTWAERTRKKK